MSAYTAEVNTATYDFPEDVCVYRLVEAQAAIRPEATALLMGDQSLSYGELNKRANQLARYLLSLADNGGPVAILMDRGFSCLTAILAVIKAGLAYVPIDPSLPKKRIEYIVNDSGTGRILVDADSQGRLRDLSIAVPVLNVDRNQQGEMATDDLSHIATDLDQEVYSIYTSGSTGEPKGVMVRHRGLTNYVCWAVSQYVTDATRTFALYSPLSFDLTVTSIFVPLVCGRSIVVYPEPQDNVPLVTRVVEDNKVDVLKLTPAHLALVRNCSLAESRIKVLILGGEDLKAEHAADIYFKFDGRVTLFNEYGPTETVVGCMIHQYDPELDMQGSVPIGAAIKNTQIYLLDEHLNPVAPGETGEIYIGGEGVAIGYRNKPEITSRQFISSPFDAKTKLYASGDLARQNSRGQLVFCGRKDQQIKLQGYRIELGEVESALLSYPGIAEAAVISTKTVQTGRETPLKHCAKCGIASNYPNTTFSEAGVCNHCQAFAQYRDVIDDYFSTMDEFNRIAGEMRAENHPKYDCIIALSGGKDSAYALCRVVDMGLRVLAFTLDNGYISDEAKLNIDRLISKLGIDHRYLATEHMDKIFADSLRRHSNVCNGCFKTIYTVAINLAREVGVDFIVTGLSKGQLLETRLGELLRQKPFDNSIFEKNLIEARKIYHRVDDAVSRYLDSGCVRDDQVMESIRFIDFYRYCDVSRQEVYAYIEARAGWQRPSDTGRSTNCLINDVGIYVHNIERKYHNYSLPYSWDVRLGHISREDALRELDDSVDIDTERVESIMADIDYQINDKIVESNEAQLVGYYVANNDIPDEQIRRHMAEVVPAYMLPKVFVRLDQIPLTPNGKVNLQGLPKVDFIRSVEEIHSDAPRNPIEEQLVDLWKEILMVNSVGIHDNFFELGGHSLPALMLLYKIDSLFNKTIAIVEFSEAPTISQLAEMIESEHPRGSSLSTKASGIRVEENI